MTENLDYVAALLHGRRSHLAERAHLQSLCRSKTVAELGREMLGEGEVISSDEIEFRLVQALAQETVKLAREMPGRLREVLHWLAGRFQIEDLKVLVRQLLTKCPFERCRAHLLSSRAGLPLDLEALAKSDSLESFVRLMPSGALRRALIKAVDSYREQPQPFFFESALDHGFLGGLLAKVEALAEEDREWVRPIIVQELDLFHLALISRGRLIYGLDVEKLRPFHLAGTKISRSLFESLLAETEFRAIGARLGGVAIDRAANQSRPGETGEQGGPDSVERLAWTRFWRLANRAFRRSHMGQAMVVAYLELRRVETANLITVCEGVRAGLPPESLYDRLIPVHATEDDHV
jgi:vacuolar-type H+-ATPase subunit C/Vma6